MHRVIADLGASKLSGEVRLCDVMAYVRYVLHYAMSGKDATRGEEEDNDSVSV